ncbi:MAG TPA: hypothetical protein VHD35_03650 [Chitinophagaceae bacterium]|nr:hypothetical protein [Chitinophagaceae bacterium]
MRIAEVPKKMEATPGSIGQVNMIAKAVVNITPDASLFRRCFSITSF